METASASPRMRRAEALLRDPRLPAWLAFLAAGLLLPTLFLGLHLDDYVHRYLLLGLPGAELLSRSYVSPYAIANGDPAQNHWLIEAGYAPWWTYDRLLLSFFRPLAVWTHRLDYALWPDSPVLMHAHSLLWFGAVVAAATLVVQSVMGRTLAAGLGALFYALDPSHGLPAGWLANRNALPAVLFGLLALLAYDRGRRHGSARAAAVAPFLFGMGLLSGEVTLGALAYVLAHALVLDAGDVKSRVRAVLPFLVVTIAWRVVYDHLGYGARGSGLYLDPAHEPLAFATSLGTRVPLLLLGQFLLPPPEAYYFVTQGLARGILVAAFVAVAALVVTATPLVRRDATARFWATGALLALPLACTAYPHGRLLYFVSLGAMALLGMLMQGAFSRAAWIPLRPAWHLVAQPFLAASIGVHLVLAPVLLPLAACSIVTTRSTTDRAVPSAIASVTSADQELVIVSAPEYFSVNLIPVMQALAGRHGPARLRLLSVGSSPLAVRRPDERSLEVDYAGGLLGMPLAELYRSARLPMTPGYTVRLQGLTIELLRVTSDGRPQLARFTFADSLESPRYRFLAWGGDEYVPFRVPAIGGVEPVKAARMPFQVGSSE